MSQIFLFLAGLVAGFIDSIAGGGGLITLPVMLDYLGDGVLTVGTNKIVGCLGAGIALWVYGIRPHFNANVVVPFVGALTLGSWTGSRLTTLIPEQAFKWLVVATCPVILYVVWNRRVWLEQKLDPRRSMKSVAIKSLLMGFVCGFYDGGYGPGGGTFMFLSLALVVKVPLVAALAISKLANTFSAGTALISFVQQGKVNWPVGATVAGGMVSGAFVGSSIANRRAEQIVRPVLVIVVVLLLVKLLT